jgi:hypothetical protein
VNSPAETNGDVLTAVLARAEIDAVFRKRLLTEPHRAIHDTFGVHVPSEFRLRFIERAADIDALVVLPDLRSTGQELSCEKLDQVTGGAQAHNAHLSWKGKVPDVGIQDQFVLGASFVRASLSSVSPSATR